MLYLYSWNKSLDLLFRKFDEISFLPFCWDLILFPYLYEEGVEHLYTCLHICLQCLGWNAIWSCGFTVSKVVYGSTNFLLCRCFTVYRQSFSAGWMSGGFLGSGLFRSSSKCSLHLFFWPSTSGIVFPFLSLIGLSVHVLTFPDSIFMVLYSCLIFP